MDSVRRELWPTVAGRPVPPAVVRAGRATFRGYGSLTAAARPLPEFLLIGAKRSGTTSFFFDLLAHPGVLPLFPSARLLPKQRDGKGPHFFDSEHARGLRWYRSHFPSRFERARVSRHAGRVLTGEASPYYLYHPLAPERAAQAVPRAKLLLLLRDPVERTFSHWREQVRNGVETLGFEQALAAEAERVGDDEARLARGEITTSFAHEQQSYAAQSEYDTGLARWLTHFPREQLHVVVSEDYYRDPVAAVAGALDFLGLEPSRSSAGRTLNAAPGAGMEPGTRQALTERFAPSVRRVEELCGRSFPWLG